MLITNDTGWKVTQTGRCLIVHERTVTFDGVPASEDISVAWGKTTRVVKWKVRRQSRLILVRSTSTSTATVRIEP